METNQIKFPPKTFQSHTISDHPKKLWMAKRCIFSSMVGGIDYPYQHHDALYDDVIGTHLFKFSLANQKARFTKPSNQSAPPI